MEYARSVILILWMNTWMVCSCKMVPWLKAPCEMGANMRVKPGLPDAQLCRSCSMQSLECLTVCVVSVNNMRKKENIDIFFSVCGSPFHLESLERRGYLAVYGPCILIPENFKVPCTSRAFSPATKSKTVKDPKMEQSEIKCTCRMIGE